MHRLIAHNAGEIRRLHAEVHSIRAHRDDDAGRPWRQAIAEFHDRYDLLAFPGGLAKGLTQLAAGDAAAIEAALCFLETRPYFFRSQYIATKLLRLLKRQDLSLRSAERLRQIRFAWRQRRIGADDIAERSGHIHPS